MATTPEPEASAGRLVGEISGPVLLAALGIPMGRVAIDDPDMLGGGMVCRRGEMLDLSPHAVTMWNGVQIPRTRPDLLEWAQAEGVPQPSSVLDDLVEAELVSSLMMWSHDVGPWLAGHRLVPQGAGRGNSSEAPAVFTLVQSDGESVIGLDVGVYYLWALSASSPNIMVAIERVLACTDLAEDFLLSRFLGALPFLLATRTAYLDKA